MSERKRTFGRTLLILCGILAMAAVVWTVGERLRDQRTRNAETLHLAGMPLAGHGSDHARAKSTAHSVPHEVVPEAGTVVRNLEALYERRAYHGAPPTIPHEVEPEMSLQQDCNVCHEKGGFAKKFKAYTPVTPHPEFENCTQCHVPQPASELWVQNNWLSTPPPNIHRPALPGSPPAIPHTLQLRDNCLSCHAGAAAPIEIRTTHPERVSCLQCHVPLTTDSLFARSTFAPAGKEK